MVKYKKGQPWNKAKNQLMKKFEKETGKSVLRGGKITGQFEYWLWQQEKKTGKLKSKIVTAKPKQSSKPKPKTKPKPKIDAERFWNRLPQKRRIMFLGDLMKYDDAYIAINKKKQWVDLSNSLQKEIKQEKNARVLKEIYNLSNAEFNDIYEEEEEYFNPDEIENGDYVDFGAYGRLYVVHRRDDRDFWVTDLADEAYNDNAPGWIIGISQAERIIRKG